MKKTFILGLLLVLLSLFAANKIELNSLNGKLINTENNWFIQTESGEFELFFAEAKELPAREIKLLEQNNFTAQCAMIDEKLTVFEFTSEKETIKLRDKHGKLVAIRKNKSYSVNPASCISCNICPGKCPVNAIEMINGKAVINADECINCGICEGSCPVGAISK